MLNKHSKLSKETEELIQKARTYWMPNYNPRDMIIDHGKGSTLYDIDGNDYIDFGAGIAVNSLGHQDPDLLMAMESQMRRVWHTSNIFYTAPAIHLAEALVNAAPFATKAFFCSTGGEANEAAIKLARKYAADNGRPPEMREIITFNGSFHGRTLATVTATAQPKYQKGFEPLPAGFVYCESFNDEEAISRLVSEKTCAILVEPVQGEGGVVPAKPGFLKHLRKLCDEVGALLIVDEVQCGVGRTGKIFAHMHDEVQPDIMTLAKALGCGVPVGAMLIGEKAQDTLQFGSHGTTFGGNPLSCAVALAAFKKINNPILLAEVEEKAQKMREALAAINEDLNIFTEIRGKGLMIGCELSPQWKGKAAKLSEHARMQGALVLVAGPNVMRFVPPLTISDADIDTGMERFRMAIDSFMQDDSEEETHEAGSTIAGRAAGKLVKRLKGLFSRKK